MFYTCAVTATWCNQTCKDFYLNLKHKGKASKLALITLANKLFREVFAIGKQKEY